RCATTSAPTARPATSASACTCTSAPASRAGAAARRSGQFPRGSAPRTIARPARSDAAPMSQDIRTHLSKADPVLGALMRAAGPCTLSTDDDCHPFQALAQAIAHQQLNGTAAATILKRLVDNCGQGCFPTPQMIIDAPTARLRAAGFSFAKVAALKDLAAKTLEAVVPHHAALAELTDEEIVARLTQVRGIGRWTVEMLLMFRLGRPDVL